MNTDERTDYEKGPEYKRVLREVLSVITANQNPEGCEDYMNTRDNEVNPEHVFGSITEWGADCIEWPDLAWAKDQIVKVLGS